MSLKKSENFRTEAVQLASDLGIGMSTLNKWVGEHKHEDLMSGSHDDVHKELNRLRKENRILREEREILKKATVFFASQKK
jgi:transposase